MSFPLPKVYPITDQRIAGISHAEQVSQFAAGGARLVQVREKYLPSGDFYSAAVDAVAAGRPNGIKIIINDRVDIALASAADGVHLGQHDLPPVLARKLLGDAAVIGLSTHNLRQAVEASRQPVDYIGVGPIFPTMTKSDPDPVVGLDNLAAIRDAVGPLPIVAIGGITLENASEVLNAGADSVALVSALLTGPDTISDRYFQLGQTLR